MIDLSARAGPEPPAASPRRSRRLASDGVWIALICVLALWVAFRLDLFRVSGVVQLGGAEFRLRDTLASVDHPFHAARANTLLRSLADGDLLRWVGDHQGGYPVEFYPLGVAWLDVGLWMLLLGTVPMIVVHKIVVGIIFLLPGLAFVLMARRDGWPLSVAGVGLAAQVAIAGGWWHGGYTELVQWGLVTNVAANVALLFTLLWLTSYLERGRAIDAVGVIVAASFAIMTNPRSLVGLGVIGGGVWLARLSQSGRDPRDARRSLLRLGTVGALVSLIAAPELMALVRFSHLYQFVRYERYADAGDYLRNVAQAVSWPALTLALVAVVAIWWLPGRPLTRAAALCLVLYATVTLLISESVESAVLSQLEATRLMPFQRLVTLYLGAVGLHLVLGWLFRISRSWQTILVDVASLVATVGLLAINVAPVNQPPPEPVGAPPPKESLFAVANTVSVSQADFRRAIDEADVVAAPGTALLVLGSALSWHQQLWAPVWTERPVFYNDWLWYWQSRHRGPPGYQFEAGHSYPVPELALERDFLRQHGIGAVAITDEASKRRAKELPHLSQVRTGVFDLYLVRQPTTVITFAGANADISQADQQHFIATGRGSGGTAEIRRNWYPRWRAAVNGQPVPISRTGAGYMSLPIPAGDVSLELTYAVDGFDWLARGLALSGVVGVAILVRGRRIGAETAERRESRGDHAGD